ncbi:MAG: demethoxyubiquinone hydroxylase family protein [Pseudomonadota bacterium]
MSATTLEPLDQLELPTRLIRDLRSDHAGETGAVAIYDGILAISRDPEIVQFAREHRDAERVHLAFFEEWLPKHAKTRLTPVWWLAGWALGAIPAIFGRRAVYATIAAVETFVVKHYEDQIVELDKREEWQALAEQLRQFQAEEDHHRKDAADRKDGSPGLIGRAWSAFVGAGSAAGVVAARLL